MYYFLRFFLLFFIYSFIGYICECTYCSIKDNKKVTNRGFLLGPYLPIYGFGASFIVLLLNGYKKEPITLFIMICFITTLLEYFTSYIMEKVFKARWWDYSEKKLNINGRVCLENSFLFGIGGLFVIYLVNPLLLNIINYFNSSFINVLSVILLVLFLLDTYVSVYTIFKLRQNSKIIDKNPLENEQIHRKINKGKFFKKRLLNAFPNIKNIKVYNYISEVISGRIKKVSK